MNTLVIGGGAAGAAAAIAAAEPTSAWQPPSAPEIEALCLHRPPIAAAVMRKSPIFDALAPGTWSSQ